MCSDQSRSGQEIDRELNGQLILTNGRWQPFRGSNPSLKKQRSVGQRSSWYEDWVTMPCTRRWRTKLFRRVLLMCVGVSSLLAANHLLLATSETTHRRRDVATVAESQTRNTPGYISHLTKSADRPHSHPVQPLPPVADVLYNKSSVDKPCSSVRVTDFMGTKLPLTGSPLCQWLEKPESMADGNMYAYGNEMALLYDVTVDPRLRHPGARGGEKMEDVWGQKEEDEYIVMKDGYFRLPCSQCPVVRFHGKNYLNDWARALRCEPAVSGGEQATSRDGEQAAVNNATRDVTPVGGLTLALQRNEYANVYFVMLSLYNAFLALLAFNAQPRDVTLLLLDAHPESGLDEVWSTLFRRVMLAGHLAEPTRFSALGWVALSHNSPLRQMKEPRVNYLEEFRRFVLNGHGVDDVRKLNCSSLRLLFVWRKDYVSHPRNQAGKVSRKIANEQELLAAVGRAVPAGDRVEGRQLDAEPMREQLRRVSQSDVVIGMHGAGLVHSLFLPRHASLVELYPLRFPSRHKPFRAIASWRGLHYVSWRNTDSRLEKGLDETYVPPAVLVDLVTSVRRQMCG